jgi:survival-of-motor-neuron-related-splicing factor 30
VIALTEEVLATAKQNEISLSDAGVSAEATPGSPDLEGAWEKTGLRNDPIHEGKFPVGTKVQAVFSDDGEWYDATIEAHTANGYFVAYDEWGNKEEVDPDNVRPIEQNAIVEAERLAQATKNALKRKIEKAASSDYQTKTLPAKLKIDPNDPEDVKIAKRKKIHAFKSKARFEQLEVVQNKKQNDWQQFQTTKAKTKKVGFFTGRKKESIFKSPEDPFGKVGVTGSGKGLTDFQKREKHLHLKSGNAEGTDE